MVTAIRIRRPLVAAAVVLSGLAFALAPMTAAHAVHKAQFNGTQTTQCDDLSGGGGVSGCVYITYQFAEATNRVWYWQYKPHIQITDNTNTQEWNLRIDDLHWQNNGLNGWENIGHLGASCAEGTAAACGTRGLTINGTWHWCSIEQAFDIRLVGNFSWFHTGNARHDGTITGARHTFHLGSGGATDDCPSISPGH
jgi:hypothetical protein